ncbi:MAG: PilZ domain-containing protein [Clostridiales bacterium]|nr:PilZ domain-containing protein [Clostridiales bacterium]
MQEKDRKERRKFKRFPIELSLEVKEVFKQDNIVIKDVNASVNAINISKSGIGFTSESELPIGYYFKALIQLGEGDFFHTVIRIVRVLQKNHDQKEYGAEFVGLAPFLADKLSKYEKNLNKVT